MENEKRKLLDEEIQKEIKHLATLTPGSKEHSETVESIEMLYKLYISDLSNEREFMNRCDEVSLKERELAQKDLELEDGKKGRLWRTLVEAGEIVVPLLFYGVWMYQGFKFEETGTFTSSTFKGLFNKFRPTK